MITQRYIKFVIYTLHCCILPHPSICIYATLSCLSLSVCPYSPLPAHPLHCRLSSRAHRSPLHIHYTVVSAAVGTSALLPWRSQPCTSTLQLCRSLLRTSTALSCRSLPRTSAATIVACMYGVIEVASCRRWGISASERRYKCRSG